MDRGAIISEAWSIMKGNRSLWGITALVLIVQVINGLLFGWMRSLIPLVIEILVDLLLAALLSGALISMVNAISEKQPVNFSTGMDAGFRWTGRLFIINMILIVPIWIVARLYTRSWEAVVGWSIDQIYQWLKAFGVSAVFILLVSILCNAISVGAERAVVLRQCSVSKALKHGWRLLWAHLGDYIVLGVFLLLINIGIGLLFLCGSLATDSVFGPVGSIRSLDYFIGPWTVSTIIRTFLILINSIVITVFESTVWTLAFRAWQAQEHSALSVAAQ